LRILIVAFSLALFAGAQGSSAPKKQVSKAKGKTSKRKPASTAHRATPGKTTKRTQATTYRRSNQLQPTPERYKEIQQALADKGYFRGTADGNWGTESVDALKRFQRDQNLTEDGKLGSLSLIALGLGPKRTIQP
jgi:peptidoglycan hydrolase-like protein with peptidoglycan-binding domain